MVYKGPDCPPMGVGYNTSSLTTKRNTLFSMQIVASSKTLSPEYNINLLCAVISAELFLDNTFYRF